MVRSIKRLKRKATKYIKGMKDWNLEALYYETKPYICAAMGAYFLRNSGLAKYAGMMLFTCGITILYMRARYRGLIR